MLWSLLLFFINEEYLIALVDFIAPCGGTIERGERDLRIPFFATEPRLRGSLDSPPLSWGIAAAGYWAAAGLCQYWNPVSGASRSSPLRCGVWVLCVRAWTVRVSVGLVWLISLVFHYWVEKRRCLFGFYARFF